MSEQTEPVHLEGGTYEIIRNRLLNHGRELRARLDKLDTARKETFGAIETRLLAGERLTTANNCVSRDMVVLGPRFIFGYNVHIGLRSEIGLADVFSIYTYDADGLHEQPLDLIRDERFQREFVDLYKYYKKTTFSNFAVIGPHFYMIFQIGVGKDDIKTFKWLIDGAGLKYLDNRSDHEYRLPPQHEFEWKRVRRDWFRMGLYPHVSIEDRVFVETVGGDLTIKVEDNTDEGSGIYQEPVDNPDQTLDDAEIWYASLGPAILLKILPYQEKCYRYFVFNEKLQEAKRIDAIEQSCVLLPDNQGIIYPKGYYLLTGESKEFDTALQGMSFQLRRPSPNGEDYLFSFFNRLEGNYILLAYNIIEQVVKTPIICSGYSLFEDGRLIYFKSDGEPQKHHAIQVWQTPFTAIDFQIPASRESRLYKIGNRDIVHGMAECHEVLKLIHKEDTYANLYVDLVKKTGDIIDSYHWLNEESAANLSEVLKEISAAAAGAIEEFEKVRRIRQAAVAEVQRLDTAAKDLFGRIRRAPLEAVAEFVTFLAGLRALRGELISARERRYIDTAALAALEGQATEQSESLSRGCVTFLLGPEALAPYAAAVAAQEAAIGGLTKVAAAREVEAELERTAGELELLIEIVSNLKIEDATETTRIIDAISAIYADLNRVRSALKNTKKELARGEGVSEFNAQMKLLGQGVINYLDVCDVPDKCETYLTKLMVQVEELEGRFSEFDEFIEQLTEKREEIYSAFEARRLHLVEGRNKRASSLMSAAERILKGVQGRAAKFATLNEINGYFAGDLMIEKVRDIVAQLVSLEDSVKADDIQSRLKTIQEEAVRQLKDRQDLFVDGANIIQLGKHKFSVNTQSLAMTVVAREGEQYFHLTGTNFFEKIDDPAFLETREVWNMEVASETPQLYRGEFLADALLRVLAAGEIESLDIPRAAALGDDELLELVRRFMGPRYAEGYSKGIHDRDACVLLRTLLRLQSGLGLLTYPPQVRACATLFWHRFCSSSPKANFEAVCTGLTTLVSLFPDNRRCDRYIAELEGLIARFLETSGLFSPEIAGEAAAYLFRELVSGPGFAISQEAGEIYRRFSSFLKHRQFWDKYEQAIKALKADPVKAYSLTCEWVAAYIASEFAGREAFLDEVAALLFCGHYDSGSVSAVPVTESITGLKGAHPMLAGGYVLNYNAFMGKCDHHRREVAPKFTHFLELKKKLTADCAEEMRLEEFKPRVLTSFVRNKLLDTVYLPLIGDNLAKQIGAAGDQKRTDRMGMLLLVSPPGYGKTTLMEYIANRLGLIFMKINGPAIGHQTTSLDPLSAPHASAREELNKLNLALEMGDNVMIYLDDIQHTHPELLQKFISLCDAQRKIEGVYKGKTRTYDLRGKKVCVVMAGNPYTESGEKFQIPDMLANRADTYNLGDIIGASREAFELSYVENSLTANPILNKLAAKSQKDVYSLVRLAETGEREGLDLEGNYAAEEISEFVTVLKKVFTVRDVVFKVNQAYIRSAAQEEAYRTEPPFKLQGSYRNMNKMVEKILPIMNEAELRELYLSHYENEAQTLTSGAEANLLKFKEMMAIASEAETARWAEIKRGFAKKQRFHGIDTSDRVGQVVAQLSSFGDGLDAIKEVLAKAAAGQRTAETDKPRQSHTTLSEETLVGLRDLLDPMIQSLAAVGTQVQTAAPEGKPEEQNALMGVSGARFLFKILRQQFEIMHQWLKPTYEAAKKQDREMVDLRRSVHSLLKTHDAIMKYLVRYNLVKLEEPGGTAAPKDPPR